MADSDSILKSVKKYLNVDLTDTSFDTELIMNINSVFNTLLDLGIGPIEGFQIEDDSTEWDEFTLGAINLNSARTYVSMSVKMIFDPPESSYHTTALKDRILEEETRLSYRREAVAWQQPTHPLT